MDEMQERDEQSTEGVTTPPVGEPISEFAETEPAPHAVSHAAPPIPEAAPSLEPLAPEAAPHVVSHAAPSEPEPMLIDELAESGTAGTAVFAAVESAAAEQAAALQAQAQAARQAQNDGRPGGEIPSSSGFSWRLPGSAPMVMHSQGGIPNEFDHLFRDSDQDNRHSLLPSQGPIGVAMPGGHAPGPGLRQAAQNAQQLPQSALPPSAVSAESGDSPLPTYQGPAVQSPTAGYPRQPYESTQHQQSAYQSTTQVPVGASESADGHHTQAIPRVPVQTYDYGNGGPQVPSVSGVAAEPVGPRGSAAKPMIVAVGVFVVLIVIAMVAFLGGGDKKKSGAKGGAGDTATSSAAAATPKSQADAIYAVMKQSDGLTKRATTAIGQIQSCKSQSEALSTFTDVAKTRQAQADAVAKLPIDKLPPEAQQLMTDLKEAWQHSADSESSYAKWAQENINCTGTGKSTATANWDSAQNDGKAAGKSKSAAATEWNALTASLGEPKTDLGSL